MASDNFSPWKSHKKPLVSQVPAMYLSKLLADAPFDFLAAGQRWEFFFLGFGKNRVMTFGPKWTFWDEMVSRSFSEIFSKKKSAGLELLNILKICENKNNQDLDYQLSIVPSLLFVNGYYIIARKFRPRFSQRPGLRSRWSGAAWCIGWLASEMTSSRLGRAFFVVQRCFEKGGHCFRSAMNCWKLRHFHWSMVSHQNFHLLFGIPLSIW